MIESKRISRRNMIITMCVFVVFLIAYEFNIWGFNDYLNKIYQQAQAWITKTKITLPSQTIIDKKINENKINDLFQTPTKKIIDQYSSPN